MGKSAKIITIPKGITNGKELVILTRDEYERQVQRSQEITEALQVILEGEKAYKEGKTKIVTSLEQVVKRNARR